MFLCIMFLIYISMVDLDFKTFVEGQITGVFFMIGGVVSPICYDTGPGGPINALVNTQIIHQTMLTALFFGQSLTLNQIIGIALGIAASLMITLCDDIIDRLCRKKQSQARKEVEEVLNAQQTAPLLQK